MLNYMLFSQLQKGATPLASSSESGVDGEDEKNMSVQKRRNYRQRESSSGSETDEQPPQPKKSANPGVLQMYFLSQLLELYSSLKKHYDIVTLTLDIYTLKFD